ncbi:MAG: hypothetical protein FJ347_09435 [Sphingomonadales bacterium]|nr:hypothetical protein [Sphingomonadales bacterium]
MKRVLSAVLLLAFGFPLLRAQLPNTVFNQQPAPPRKSIGFQADVFPFLKNNEYFNAINPGETFFGFRTSVAGVFNLQPGGKARFTTGLMVQENYGDAKTVIKPMFSLSLTSYKEWNYVFGTLVSGTRHGLIEPLYNYEQVLTQPLEYGIQVRRDNSKMFYDGWLEWRQRFNSGNGTREMLVAGQHIQPRLSLGKNTTLSLPLQMMLVHQGGQSVNNPLPISTRIAATGGLRLAGNDTGWVMEGYALQSLDNSPNPQQPWKNGYAFMANLQKRFGRYHRVAATWWFAREFTSTLGNPVFTNVNLGYPYANEHTRRIAMLRYVYTCPILGNNLWIDARIEPHYDFERAGMEFSHGLYLRYIRSGSFSIPRIPGFF